MKNIYLSIKFLPRLLIIAIPFFWLAGISTFNMAYAADLEFRVPNGQSAPSPLDRSAVNGDIYVFVPDTDDIQRVIFSLNGTTVRTENNPPYDFAGGSSSTPRAFDTTTLSDGNHNITAEIQLDNGGIEVEVAMFTVNNNAPTLNFNPVSLDITAEENGVPIEQAVTLSMNGAIAEDFTFSSNVPWLTVTPPTGTTPSQLTVTADPAGLTSGTYSGLLTATSLDNDHLDATLPVTLTVVEGSLSYRLISTAADRSNSASLKGVTIFGDMFVSINPETDIKRVIFYIDGSNTSFRTENFAPFDLKGGSAKTPNAFDTTTLSDGDHNITAEVQLKNGDTEFVVATFTVNNNIPALTFNSVNLDITAEEDGIPVEQTVTLSTTNAIAEDFTFSSNVSWMAVTPPSGTTPSQLTVTVDPTGLASGTYSGLLMATSLSSNHIDATLPVTFTVVTGSLNNELLISSTKDRANSVSLNGVTVFGDMFVSINSETDIHRVIFYIDGSNTSFHTENRAPFDFNGGSVATANTFDTSTLSNGNHSITAEIQLYNGDTEYVVATFTVSNTNEPSNTAPTISGSPSATATEDSVYVYQPIVFDADGDKLTFSIVNRPTWASFNTSNGRLTGTPDDGNLGTYSNINISVSDGSASTSTGAFSIMVYNTNDAPIISGSPMTRVEENSLYSFQPLASDPDGDSLVFSISGRPSWATFNNITGQLSGTPDTSDAATYSNILISVSDGTASSSLPAFSIVVDTVGPVNTAPTISGSPSTKATEGSAYTFQPIAFDADGDKLTFTIYNRPTWASFDGSNGRLSGTPAEGDAGTDNNIIISVSDGSLSTELPTFSIQVDVAQVQTGAGNFTLRWSEPVSRVDNTTLFQTEIASFSIHYGTSTGIYPNSIDVDNTGQTHTVTNLPEGTYYVVMTTKDTQGRESTYSEEITKEVQ